MALVPEFVRNFYKDYKFEDPTIACGVWPFTTTPHDPMLSACAWHDAAYTDGSWEEQNLSRAEVDYIFLGKMLQIAGDSFLLKARAYTYYALVRALGWPFWEGEK